MYFSSSDHILALTLSNTLLTSRLNLMYIMELVMFIMIGYIQLCHEELLSYMLLESPQTNQVKSTAQRRSTYTNYSSPPQHTDHIDDSLPLLIYMTGRAPLTIPVEADRDILVIDTRTGIIKDPDLTRPDQADHWGHNVGMRFIWIPHPPKNLLFEYQASGDWAWN
jgi:hypothetical protein